MGCASTGHITKLKQSIFAFRYLCSPPTLVLMQLLQAFDKVQKCSEKENIFTTIKTH
jgi:hypothetical protein